MPLLEGGRGAVEWFHLLHRRRSIVSFFKAKQERKMFDRVMVEAGHRNDRVSRGGSGERQDRSPATGQIHTG